MDILQPIEYPAGMKNLFIIAALSIITVAPALAQTGYSPTLPFGTSSVPKTTVDPNSSNGSHQARCPQNGQGQNQYSSYGYYGYYGYGYGYGSSGYASPSYTAPAASPTTGSSNYSQYCEQRSRANSQSSYPSYSRY